MVYGGQCPPYFRWDNREKYDMMFDPCLFMQAVLSKRKIIMLNNYETMFIIRPDLAEDQVSQEVNKYQDFLKERNVEDLTIRNHGKKRLAYKIDKHQDGIYVQMNYRVDGEVIKALQRQMRLSENVIRFLTLTVEEIPPAPTEGETPPLAAAQPERVSQPKPELKTNTTPKTEETEEVAEEVVTATAEEETPETEETAQ